MKTKLTHAPFWPTLFRYAKTLHKDVSFTLSAKLLLRLLLLAFGLFMLLGFAGHGWARVYAADCHGTQTWREFLFGLLGAIDAEPDEVGSASVIYSAFVRLLGAIVIGGVITSFLCALVERFAEMKLKGLLVPVLRDHFVVIGYGTMTDDLIRALLDPETDPADDLACWIPQERHVQGDGWMHDVRRRKVLLCTGGDVERIRETLTAVLPQAIACRIVYAFGDMNLNADRDEVCKRLCLEDARQIYIVGDEAASSAGDVENLAFAKGVGEYLRKHNPKHPDGFPKPVFVRLDGGASFDFVKKISFETDPTAGKSIGEVTSFFKPFSFTEGWARRIWGEAIGGEPDAEALDFAPMGGETSVHLVVAGLTPMGEALVLQAARVCHFPNGLPSRITVVDPDESVEPAFFSRHPSLRDALQDVSIDFLPARIESEKARALLREAALDEQRLLTVAICFRHSDTSLSAALNLPEEVYWHRMDGGKKNIRDKYRENGARIWVFQEHRDGLAEQAETNPRYGNIRPFGMQEGGFTPWCLREFCAMYLNAVYDWPIEAGCPSWLDGCAVPALSERIAAFRRKWEKELAPDNPYGVFDIDATEKKDLMVAILSEGGEKEVRRFQEYAFRKYVLLKPELRWANLYVSDSYGVAFRALGLRAVHDRDASFSILAQENNRVFVERREATKPAKDPDENPLPGHFDRSLAETEHDRWMADRALMGYRAPRPGTGERRDDAFRYHNDMIPFDKLSPSEQDKDELSISCIPLFMALEGIKLERG